MTKFPVVLLTGMALLNVGGAVAQSVPAGATSGTPVNVTGCLVGGKEANDYRIRDAKGKLFGLAGTKVDLKEHVGHQVTITGMVAKDADHDGHGKPDGAPGANEETAQVNVTALKMVSTTCQ